LSRRYSAITLLGLSAEPPEATAGILGGRTLLDLGSRLLSDVGDVSNLGDVALTLWGARASGHGEASRALARLAALRPESGALPTVELSWALSALSAHESSAPSLRDALADRLRRAFNPTSELFPHVVERTGGLRGHVSCFADLVYPIQALALHARAANDAASRDIALRCAERLCRLQGPQGQWWWHYDYRTGRVIEPFPVYAIHQDAMGPMALFDCAEACEANFDAAAERGLGWLFQAPELGGKSLIDEPADLIWRKVARREPAKLARTLQAAASRAHPAWRVPGLDGLLPPGAVDFEDRPYHLGWLLHAWPGRRVARWPS
jgi:hypothetical protein